ncbi:MAG: RagB/SusD family nutrient uptake outer membrane protein [Rikenellaceae bacterium]|nr:RagB/SusD family nutrient uptake outer membrane protein [Rikenellaceae bacterium]
MKKILIAAMVFATAALVGCEQFLQEDPQSSFSDGPTFWKGEEALRLETNYFYSSFSSYGAAHSGRYYAASKSDDYGQDNNNPEYSVTIPSGTGVWASSYQEARRANLIMARMANMELSDEVRKHYEGFCRYYRAIQHFDVVRAYGDCVWQGHEVNMNDEAWQAQERTDRAEIMRKVCEDLQFAGENCRDYSDGRAFHKYVAYVMLSRVALFEGTWQKYHENNATVANEFFAIAKAAALEVMNSGKWSIHDNYGANYISKDLKGNSEMIMYKQFQYDAEIKLGHGLHGYSSSSTPTWGMTKDAVESYCNADGLPIHVSEAGFDDSTVQSAIAGRDARLAHNVCDSVVMLDTYSWLKGINSTTGYWLTKFVVKDYVLNGGANELAPYNDTDGPVFMYSEVLLNYAEACAEMGSMTQADADKSINLLRTQHGKIPALTVAGTTVSVNGTVITKDPKNIYGVNELIWEVRRERRNELICDGFRTDDLKRWKMGAQLDFAKNPSGIVGVSEAAVQAYYDYTKNVYDWNGLHDGKEWADIEGDYWRTIGDQKYISAFHPDRNRVFDETKNYLDPLPSGITLINPNLGQNPGWN